jgi:hypothetical protein
MFASHSKVAMSPKPQQQNLNATLFPSEINGIRFG